MYHLKIFYTLVLILYIDSTVVCLHDIIVQFEMCLRRTPFIKANSISLILYKSTLLSVFGNFAEKTLSNFQNFKSLFLTRNKKNTNSGRLLSTVCLVHCYTLLKDIDTELINTRNNTDDGHNNSIPLQSSGIGNTVQELASFPALFTGFILKLLFCLFYSPEFNMTSIFTRHMCFLSDNNFGIKHNEIIKENAHHMFTPSKNMRTKISVCYK